MSYVIRYFRAGREQGSTPWSGSLAIMEKIAADGLVRHGMDRAEIIDQTGAVLWSQPDSGASAAATRPAFFAAALRKVGGIKRRG